MVRDQTEKLCSMQTTLHLLWLERGSLKPKWFKQGSLKGKLTI